MGVSSHQISQKRNSDKGDFAVKKRTDAREEDDCSYVSLSDGDTNEHVPNLRQISAIPALKNTETLKKLDFSMRNMHLSQKRLVSCGGDPFKVSMLLINDIKFISDQLFSLWFKFINLLTINPKFVTEFLRILYEEKMREYWGEHIYRTIVEIEDFALPSEENVGEIHRQIAQQRRQSLIDQKQ